MLYRVFGPAGSKKEERLLALAKEAYEAGEEVFVIVPEQATARYERNLVEVCGNRCNDRVEVTNFSRLSNVVLRTFGSLCHKILTEEERLLLLYDTVQEKKDVFRHLSGIRQPEEIRSLYGELEEARLAGLSLPQLRRLREEQVLESELEEKLGEILLVEESLEEKLIQMGSPYREEEDHLADLLTDYPFFRGKTVIVDLFWDFTAPQERLLKRILGQAKTVAISFFAIKKEDHLFQKGLDAARSILRLAQEVGCKVEDISVPEEDDGSAISFLKTHFGKGSAPYPGTPEGIHLVPQPDPAGECAFIAHTVEQMVHAGASWCDFAVLSRSGENHRLLALILDRAGIPYFLEEKEPFADTDLAVTLLLGTRIALGKAKEEEIRTYLAKGVFLCGEKDRFLLEKYIATWHTPIRSLLSPLPFQNNPDGYEPLKPDQEAELKQINEAKKRIFTPLANLSLALASGSNKEKITALVAFLAAAGTEKTLLKQMEDYKEQGLWDKAGERVRFWNALLERLSSLGRALGEKECTAEEFLSLLTLSLSGSAPGDLPNGQDRVQIGLVGFMRPHRAKHIFLMGCGTGIFPAVAAKGTLLTQRDREALSQLGYPLLWGEKALREEKFLFYLALSYAKETLFLTWSAKEGEKEEDSLSVFGKRVRTLFPRLPLTRFSAEDAMPLNKEDAFRYVLTHIDEESPLMEALKQAFLQEEPYRERLLTALAGLSFAGSETELIEEKPYRDRDMTLSYTTMETYSKCRFAWFAKYLLYAKETKEAVFGGNITGSFVHRVLELFLADCNEKGISIGQMDDALLTRRCREICDEVIGEISTDEIDDPKLLYLLKRIRKSTLTVLKKLRDEFSGSLFLPLYFEKDLKELGTYRLPLPDGTYLSFTGSIDRVDRYVAEDGKVYVRVVDYKTGSHSFSLEEVANGLDLQMLLYLFALWGKPLGPAGEEVHPASVLYLNGMEKMSSCGTREEMEKVKEDTRYGLSREGLFLSLPELLSAQDPEGKGEFIPVAWNTRSMAGKENLVTLAELGRLRSKVEQDFIRFANGMKEGKIAANPLFSEKKNLDPCQYCQHILMCKRNPACRRDYRTGITKSKFLSEEDEAQ